MGRTCAQNNHNPSHPEAAPGASSHLPSTQCALRRREVPSTGHTACLASQAAGESHGWRMQKNRKQYLGNCSFKVFVASLTICKTHFIAALDSSS